MTTASQRIVVSAACVAAIHATALLVVGTAMFASAPFEMGLGLTIDLTVTATLLVYLVAVRPGHLPALALVPLFGAGLLTARLLLGEQGNVAIAVLGGAFAVVEVGAAGLALIRLRRIVLRFLAARREGLTRRFALADALTVAVRSPRIAGFIATEVAVMWMALTGWFRRAPPDAGDFFAVHRRRAWNVIAATLGLLLIVESAGVHLLLSRISPMAAWIATGTSIYALLWLIGDAHALRLSGVRVNADALEITVGLRWHASIPRATIRSVTRIDGKLPTGKDLAACELLWPNVLITLHTPLRVVGPFGSVKHVTRLTLTCDRETYLTTRVGPLPDPAPAL